MNTVKNMQDNTAPNVVCSHCSQVIVFANEIKDYREEEVSAMKARHKCPKAMESKRDFEDEVR